MRFKVEVGGITALFDAYTLERLIELMADNDCYVRNWSSSATQQYEIKPVDIENLKVTAMPQATYDTLKLATKLGEMK